MQAEFVPQIVSSWNEWDPLEMGFEPALSPYSLFGGTARLSGTRAIPSELIDAAERQLDHFAELLLKRGIAVQRPDPIDHNSPAKTPDWEIGGGHATACPRDVLLVIGNEIIEAPMAQRSRYFEFRGEPSGLRPRSP